MLVNRKVDFFFIFHTIYIKIYIHIMERENIINDLRQFFGVKELVCNHVYDRWGEASWQFMNTSFLHTLLIIRRDILKQPMLCNNSSNFTQRGLRCNCCEIVKSKTKPYLSAHVLGIAGDFSITDMSAEEARELIKKNKELLPYNIRMEDGVTWLHIDMMPQYNITDKVYEFKV